MAYTDIDKPSDYFNTVLNVGDDTSPKSITGFGFQPDLVWTKTRTYGNNHTLFDSVRGAGSNKELMSNSTGAEGAGATDVYGYLSSFDSDGFTATAGSSSPGTNYFNFSGYNYANWGWLAGGTAVSNTDGSITSSVSANTTAGFSIVSYTGTGSNATVGHGLGVAPKVVIVKQRSAIRNWQVYHGAISGMSGGYITLNNTDGFLTNITNIWNGNPNSTTFGIGTNTNTNESSGTYIAYCFAEKKGFSKFGSYTGNGSADGTFVYTGFKPAFVIVKSTGVKAWIMIDTTRDVYNPQTKMLFPNNADVEYDGTSAQPVDRLSNGFKIRNADANYNSSGQSYIYMAFAENPFTTSTGIPTTAR